MLADRHPFDIFHDEILGLKFVNEANEMKHQRISGVVEEALANQGKSLAGRPAKEDIYLAIANFRSFPNLSTCNLTHTLTNGGAMGEVVLVGGTVNGIDFYRSENVKTRLLESQAQSPRPGK